MSQKKPPLIGVLIFAGGFLYLGWEVVKQETGALRGGSASESWPTVDGTITESTTHSSTDSDGRSHSYPVVEYEYSVDGNQYHGDRFSFQTQSTDHETAEAISKRYPVGRTVSVFYDPADASSSVLEPGASSFSWLGIGIGVVFAIVAGTMLVTRLVRSGS